MSVEGCVKMQLDEDKELTAVFAEGPWWELFHGHGGKEIRLEWLEK